MNNLVWGLVAGAVGMAYFIYGKRQQRFAPLIAGMLLCVYPYFVHGALSLALIGVALIAAPFVLHF
ncbi:MAG: hypothetical protein JSS46_16370 [Proteobacteria bacterium]|jgi:hypothetical protein|nr:hypothetical protein [Pseudomonadota bacterium]